MKPFEECLRLTLELHTLIDAGKGDEAEADEVRDKIDGPHRELQPAERWLVNLVSGALYGDAQAQQHLESVRMKAEAP